MVRRVHFEEVPDEGEEPVSIGAFDDSAVRAALELAASEAPLALLPVGAPR